MLSFKDNTIDVLGNVGTERARQDKKWGEQNHPDGTSRHFKWKADALRVVADTKAQTGTLTWRDILMEEVWEAMAEEDPVLLRTELVQVAAVAVGWVEALDRRERRTEACLAVA
jgi:hypothetical protein